MPVSVVLVLVFASMAVCAHPESEDTVMAEQHHGHHHFELPGQHDVKKAKKHDEKLVKPDIDDATDEELDQFSRDDKEGKQLRSQYQKLVAKDRCAARKEAKKRRREYEDFMEE